MIFFGTKVVLSCRTLVSPSWLRVMCYCYRLRSWNEDVEFLQSRLVLLYLDGLFP